jgi:hypothetical protein
MSEHESRKLLNDVETRERLGRISVETLQWLVDTGQLSEIWLRGERFFDSEDVTRLIQVYKSVQSRRARHCVSQEYRDTKSLADSRWHCPRGGR